MRFLKLREQERDSFKSWISSNFLLAVIALCVAAVLLALALVLLSVGRPSRDDVEAKASDWLGREVDCKVALDIPEDLGAGQVYVCDGREFILQDDRTLYGPDGIRIP